MAHKTLLTEGEIRQFLKLANLKNVGDDKIQEYGGMMPGERDGEAAEDAAGMPPMADDAMELADDADAMADAADDLADDADDLDAGAVDGLGDTEREEVLADVVAAVAQALGIEDRVNVEAGEEDAMDDMGMGDEPMDMGMEPEAALAPEEGGEDSLEGPDDLGVELEDDEEEPVQMSEDEIVAEVARRVARRLKEERSRDNMADVLAERIMKRLTKK
tara:strand:- start:4719 stop:5372 length:654 start_codon:yes stop_codon:yes gene_type:complete